MQVFVVVEMLEIQVEKGRQKTRPHVEKIETVKTMGNYQKEAGQGVDMGAAGQKEHEESHGETAQACIEQGCGQASQHKIVCDKRSGGNQDPPEVLSQRGAGPGVNRCGGRGDEK